MILNMINARRIKKARASIQEACIHHYQVSNQYEITEFENMVVEVLAHTFEVVDLYCPACDKTLKRISLIEASGILKKQEIRDEYLKQ